SCARIDSSCKQLHAASGCKQVMHLEGWICSLMLAVCTLLATPVLTSSDNICIVFEVVASGGTRSVTARLWLTMSDASPSFKDNIRSMLCSVVEAFFAALAF